MLFLILAIILGALLYLKLVKPTSFWAKKGVTHVASWPLVGSLGAVVFRKKHSVEVIKDIYNKFPNERYVGYMQFSTPALLIRDLDLIKQLGVKEFDHFHDHMGVVARDTDPLLSKSLINLIGDEWKQMRATLSPVFTSSKMRNMYHLMAECAENFANHFQGKEQVAVEMKDIFSRFANDVIATTAFGIQVDSMKEPKHEFFEMGARLTQFSFAQGLKMFFFQFVPTLAKALKARILREDVATFFQSIILDNIRKREKEGIIRQDLIHLLMEARKGKLRHDQAQNVKEEGFATVEESHIGKSTNQMELTDEHIVAQAVLFFFAGFDTVSTASCFMAHELAVNPDVQKKLQEEIDACNRQHDGKVPYEALLSMKYLDQVVSETLRLWPPASPTDRACTRDYTIQPKGPSEKPLLLEKDVMVIIPTIALHYDPQYFSEPERFDPERFSDENKSKIIPGTYMPFGLGPRNCIGSRFALLEMKTLFFHLLSKLDIVPIDKTEIPMKISPKQMLLAPENGFHLGFRPRKLTS